MATINTFQDLEVWKRAHRLVLEVYKVTAKFPESEKYNLVSQMRRAAISIPSNVVEGFKRRTVKESLNFYNISSASLEELKYQLFLSKELNYINNGDYKKVVDLSNEVGKMLYSWSKSQLDNSRQD